MIVITPDELFAFGLSGVIFSLILEYFPKLSDWYNALSDRQQQLIVLVAGFLVVLVAFLLSCIEVFTLPYACTALGLKDILIAFFAFIVTNQATYLVIPKPVRK